MLTGIVPIPLVTAIAGLLFGQPGRSFFVTELIELADVGRGAVQRELLRLERSGLVVTERHGNQKHCRTNSNAPIYNELCSIISKAVGVQEQVRAVLEPLAAHALSLAALRKAGYRSDSRYIVFQCLKHTFASY